MNGRHSARVDSLALLHVTPMILFLSWKIKEQFSQGSIKLGCEWEFVFSFCFSPHHFFNNILTRIDSMHFNETLYTCKSERNKLYYRVPIIVATRTVTKFRFLLSIQFILTKLHIRVKVIGITFITKSPLSQQKGQHKNQEGGKREQLAPIGGAKLS